MYPSSQDLTGPETSSLESRLRGLILNNVSAAPSSSGISPPSNAEETAARLRLPPHMLNASPQDQQEYLDSLNRPKPFSSTNSQSSQPKSKRPNQAQRRQMNSQLSIPIESKPQMATRSPGHGPTSGYSQPQWAKQSHYGSSHIQQNHQRQHQNQPYSPRYQNRGPSTPYSPHNPFSQNVPRSPFHSNQQNGRGYNGPHQSPQMQNFQSGSYSPRPQPQGRQLYQPGTYQGQGHGANFSHDSDDAVSQSSYLESLVQKIVPEVGIEAGEEAEKEAFRALVEQACRQSIFSFENDLGHKNFDPMSIELQCFGSMKSGFATKASDMDLALLSPNSQCLPDAADSPIPRLLERTLLDMGFGARLLTRTRVPIIKLCQFPTEKLRADLLVERTKWENGFVDSTTDVVDSQRQQVAGATDHDTEAMCADPPVSNPVVSSIAPDSSSEAYGNKLANFKQKDQQSLGDYHISAKRLLRQLGSRDIASVAAPDVSPEEAKILNDVCKAFISGLSSETMIKRLKNYSSVSALFDSAQPLARRTLQGVWLQVDGERLVMNWDSRPLTEDTDMRELECQHLVDEWVALQNSSAPKSFDECIKFNRDLYMANERLKRITSLQLACLEQIQHEEIHSYFFRTQKLQDLLKGRERSESTVVPIVVAHYINGIYSPEIREVLQQLVTSNTTLYRVAAQHRVIQLVLDYEHALNLGVYEDVDRPFVEQYVAHLRSINITHSDYNINSANNKGDSDLITKVRLLADPSMSSLHRPRDRYKDHLEFPKTDIGIQCDINFSAHLAIHNTLLLRCYSHCDPRVKMMILFVKHWAKLRGINTPYRGSLSSYGYVLMVLHYLVNVAQPFVCPNLQARREPTLHSSPTEIDAGDVCNGCDVRFWRNEAEIKHLAERKALNHNHDSIGFLLRGFFEYYAQSGQMTTLPHRGFDWGREILSLRTQGGILSKQEKGWVGAKTIIETNLVAPPTPSFAKPVSPSEYLSVETLISTAAPAVEKKAGMKNDTATGEVSPATADLAPKPKTQKQVEETKEIRHRYLFAIEDPFELDHNVARTVTHNGIVSIRDEFRRAWRILRNICKPEQRDGGLLDAAGSGGSNVKGSFQELMYMLHGPMPRDEISSGGGTLKVD